MEILSLGIVSLLVTGVVQLVKKRSPINPLYVLAGISIAAASIYVILSDYGYWEVIVEKSTIIASVANLIYNVFKSASTK